jgi:hypothetical protein
MHKQLKTKGFVFESVEEGSNAAVTFLRETDGRLKLSWLSPVMAGVSSEAGARRGWSSTPIPYAGSTLCATPVSSKCIPPE